MAKKIDQLIDSVKSLLKGQNNLNIALNGRNGVGGVSFNNVKNPFNLAKLTSTSFWSDVIATQDKVRLKALSINTTPQKLAEMAGTGVNRAGFNNAVLNQFEMLTTGLDSSLESTKELGLQMRLTGQNETKLYQTMRQSQVIGGLTNKGMETLTDHMMSLGQTYNISTEALVDSIQQIAANMDVAALGLTENFSKVNADVTARFGAGAATLLTQLESQFAAGQTFVTDQIVGAIDGLGDTVESAKQYTQIYANRFGEFIKQFPPQMKAKGLEIAKGIFGEQGLLSYNFSKLLAQGERPQTDTQNKFNSLNTAMATLYTPLQELANTTIPFLSTNIVTLTAVMAGIQGGQLLGGLGKMGGSILGNGAISFGVLLSRLVPAVVGISAIGLAIWSIYKHFNKTEEKNEELISIEKRREQRELEKSRQEDQLQTSKYMELQSKALSDSLSMIIYNTDISRTIAANKDKKQIELAEKLITVIGQSFLKQRDLSRPSMDGNQ